MTGTAETEALEFQQIYGLEVAVIPTHQPMVRKDHADFVYLSERDKFQAIIEDILECVKRGQPVLVGTTSIETSERLAKLLAAKIPHEVLNAKQHEREAHIVAKRAGPGRHHRHQHGGSRHRHRARRQPADADRRDRRTDESEAGSAIHENGASGTSRCSQRAACTSSAPSATSRAASTISCAAVRAARATRARAGSICRSRTT